jgi:DNA-binding NarL/FixJ family response regulator
MAAAARLSNKSVAVLRMIASGWSYAQIVDGHPDLSYVDIFAAAKEALDLDVPRSNEQERIAQIRQSYPRAYEAWTAMEEGTLLTMLDKGSSVEEIARTLQRKPSAIHSRMKRWGLED